MGRYHNHTQFIDEQTDPEKQLAQGHTASDRIGAWLLGTQICDPGQDYNFLNPLDGSLLPSPIFQARKTSTKGRVSAAAAASPPPSHQCARAAVTEDHRPGSLNNRGYASGGSKSASLLGWSLLRAGREGSGPGFSPWLVGGLLLPGPLHILFPVCVSLSKFPLLT